MRQRILFLFLLVWLVLAFPALAQETGQPWPTDGWQTSSPEAQGMDSELLTTMVNFIAKEEINIHSALVIRNGYLVLEAYRHPYTADTLHHIWSGTKSFTSTLIGIANDQGFIKSLEKPMLAFFPDRTAANLNEAKQAITLEHLLTMSSGLDWGRGSSESPTFNQLVISDDWLQFVLDRPMKDEPGQQFDYNSGVSNLLAAIVEQTTGQNALEFAQANLFGPLGIHTVNWATDPQGHYLGGWGLRITPRDMAKLGYLFLNNGQWDGQQIVSADWVAAATQEHITTGGRSPAGSYGYQWWIDVRGYYMASGSGGQYIIVYPQQNLVVVFTSGLPDSAFTQPEVLFWNMIVPAIQSDVPLLENPEGAAALESAIHALANPSPSAIPPLPEIAARISGVSYQLQTNDFGWKSLSLTFTEGANIAQLALDEQQLEVGLDHLFRVNRRPDYGTWLLKGYWKGEDRFDLELEILGEPGSVQFRLTFEDRIVKVFASASYGLVSAFEGTAKK